MIKKGKGKNKRECLEAMRRLLVQDRAQNTKNPMIPTSATDTNDGGAGGGVEVANIILNNLVVVHNSHVRSTN
jgi:hypothetical protein